jgi:hypothetical protein
MNPKTLQIILGHSTINITMNLYCHVTEDTLISEMSKFESGTAEQGVNQSDGCQCIRREAPVEVPEGVKVV